MQVSVLQSPPGDREARQEQDYTQKRVEKEQQRYLRGSYKEQQLKKIEDVKVLDYERLKTVNPERCGVPADWPGDFFIVDDQKRQQDHDPHQQHQKLWPPKLAAGGAAVQLHVTAKEPFQRLPGCRPVEWEA